LATVHNGISEFSRRLHKPILILEIGWRSIKIAAEHPLGYKLDLPVDAGLQARLWEEFFRTWHGDDALAGYMILEYLSEVPPSGDLGYSPEGKSSDHVIRTWLIKPWNVPVSR